MCADSTHYPAAARAQSGVKQSFVNKKILKCVLNARYTALAVSKEHVDKENRTYFTCIMPQDQYGSIPFRSNLSIYTVYTGNRSNYYVTIYVWDRDATYFAHMKIITAG